LEAFHPNVNRIGARSGGQSPQQASDVFFNGLHANADPVRNFLVYQTFGNEAYHLRLANCEGASHSRTHFLPQRAQANS